MRCTATDCISPPEASCSLGRCGSLSTRKCTHDSAVQFVEENNVADDTDMKVLYNALDIFFIRTS